MLNILKLLFFNQTRVITHSKHIKNSLLNYFNRMSSVFGRDTGREQFRRRKNNHCGTTYLTITRSIKDEAKWI